MPKLCAVVGCHNQSGRDLNFSFFKLPRSTTLRQLWIRAINRADSEQSRHWYVCSAHFQTGRPVLADSTHIDHIPHLKMASGRKRSRVQSVPRTRKSECLQLQVPEDEEQQQEEKQASIVEEALLKWCNDQIILGGHLGIQITDETLQTQAGLIWRTLNPSSDAPDTQWISEFRNKHSETLCNNTAILQLVVTPPGVPPQLVNLPVLITEPAKAMPSSQNELKTEIKDEENEEEEDVIKDESKEALFPSGEEALSAVETIKRFLRQDEVSVQCPETNSALILVEEIVQEKYFEMKNKSENSK